MLPTTPPASNLSRARLKALAKWVRDELDLRVAREGPNVLRPDDVLILHETFIALRNATDVTALDLRATGIHRAVQDIAGVATRWPGRLCDDCDKIISIWTAKFGPLNELPSFLYGRGGRLEGIANVTEYSPEALLKRWAEYCPENLHPKRSHRLGDLGFRAGDWWISTLFAHHAGIIGLEAVEGGTTFDKRGAYALVLKDRGEDEAPQETTFVYRVPQWDKGKYRLTAATPRSRDPIRVLRCHSINSVWGPKAGVRYEGLYSIKGWSITQAKTSDIASDQWKEGDILFHVRFERTDIVPFSEVINRPTATELDDYTEYKRLRKFHRDGKRKAGLTIDISSLAPAKAAPPIAPPVAPLLRQPNPIAGSESAAPKILRKGSPRKPTFKHLHFDLPDERFSLISRSPTATPNVPSPVPSPLFFEETDTDYFFAEPSPHKASKLAGPSTDSFQCAPTPPANTTFDPDKERSPATRSELTGASVHHNIREVAPWIDFDADLRLPEDIPVPLSRQVSSERIPPLLRSSPTVASRILERNLRLEEDSSPLMSPWGNRRKSIGLGSRAFLLSPNAWRKDDQETDSGRKSIFVRTKNPMAKLFDGAGEHNDDDEPVSPRTRSRHQTSSSHEGVRVISPIPIRPPISPESPFALGRRGAIYSDGAEEHDFSRTNTHSVSFSPTNTHSFNFSPTNHPSVTSPYDNDDPSVESTSPWFPMSLISRATTSVATHTHTQIEAGEVVSTSETIKEEGKVVFKYPRWDTPKTKARKKRNSLDVAPDDF